LQFCGSHSVQLVQPVVQHVWLQNITSDGGWSSVAVAFGGNVSAAISAGRFTGNAATHVPLARGKAQVTVSNSVFSNNLGSVAAAGGSTMHVLSSLVVNNYATVGGGLHVTGTAQVSINNSKLSNNSADNAPALFADGKSTVGILHSLISNHTDCTPYGCSRNNVGAVSASGSSQLTVARSAFRHNRTPPNAYGGAMCLAGGARGSISNSTFVSNTGGFGGALFMQSRCLTVSDCEFMLNQGTEGGAVLDNKEGAQVMTAANASLHMPIHSGKCLGSAEKLSEW
jgi:hypothetical protein